MMLPWRFAARATVPCGTRNPSTWRGFLTRSTDGTLIHVLLTSVTLSYRGTSYTFQADSSRVKGRLACDCDKSRLIQETSDPEFALLTCGGEIAIVSVGDAGPIIPRSKRDSSL
jgi:hypothetical protein